MPEPIEIRPEDIIKRPLTAGATSQAEGFSLKNIKGSIQQLKEMKEMLESLGLDLSGLGAKLGGKQAAPMPANQAPAATSQNQLLNFIKLLQARYGDVTVNELLEKLRADFGDWNISKFTKGMML